MSVFSQILNSNTGLEFHVLEGKAIFFLQGALLLENLKDYGTVLNVTNVTKAKTRVMEDVLHEIPGLT